MGNTTLFNAVFIRPEQVVRFLLCIWKKGKVSPLFKSGDRCDPNNYRPITVLPALSKIMEKLVHIQLYSYLNENNLIRQSVKSSQKYFVHLNWIRLATNLS